MCRLIIQGIIEAKDNIMLVELQKMTFVNLRDDFSPFNSRIAGIICDPVVGKQAFEHIQEGVDGHLTGRVTVAQQRRSSIIIERSGSLRENDSEYHFPFSYAFRVAHKPRCYEDHG